MAKIHPTFDSSASSSWRPRAGSACLLAVVLALPGCTVLAIADVAASAVVGTAGLAVDAAVGTAKIGGKIIGKTADVIVGGDSAPAD